MPAGEKNYHVFYSLCEAATSLALENPRNSGAADAYEKWVESVLPDLALKPAREFAYLRSREDADKTPSSSFKLSQILYAAARGC